MPKKYQKKSELYFAGGFVNSATPYCAYLFSEIKDNPNVHYLGIITGEKNKIQTLSSMDVVVVASRDESCSLVALEGAMLSKPIIVTENVGAKYMVTAENGIIVESDDVTEMKNAMMKMIDNKQTLKKMGESSREIYEKYAGIEAHTKDLGRLFEEPLGHEFNFVQVIVSLTSHPGRINTLHLCIASLLKQTYNRYQIFLWLSEEQFPNKNAELPQNLLMLESERFHIRWVKEDIKPHKKYFYAMQEFPDVPVIVLDDDVHYDEDIVNDLMESYKKFPDCISCTRGNLMTFNTDKNFRSYKSWILNYRILIDMPTYQVMPTGIGGVLYPPKSIPKFAFNINVIKETCLLCDDIWLKVMAVYNGYKTVVTKKAHQLKLIKDSQNVALWKMNVVRSNNDHALQTILDYVSKKLPNDGDVKEKIRRDRFF